MQFEGIPKPMNRLESIVGIGIKTREDYRGEELSRKQKERPLGSPLSQLEIGDTYRVPASYLKLTISG